MDEYAQWELSQILTSVSYFIRKDFSSSLCGGAKRSREQCNLFKAAPRSRVGRKLWFPGPLIRSLTPLHGSIGNKLARTTLHSENYLFSPRAQASSLIFPTNKGVLPLQLHHTFTSGEAISISRQHDSKYLNTWFNQATQCIWTSSDSKERNMASGLPLCTCFALGHCSHTTSS